MVRNDGSSANSWRAGGASPQLVGASCMAPLVRPSIRDDEYFPMWVRRVIAACGVKHPTAAGVAWAAEALSQRLGADQVRQHAALGGGLRAACEYGVHRLPRRSLRGRDGGRMAVCPTCLDRSPHFRLIWLFTGYEVCLQHGVTMKSHCSACSRAWTGAEVLRGECLSCKCGIASTGATEVVDPIVLQLCELVWHEVELDAFNCATAAGAKALARATLLHRLVHVASRARWESKPRSGTWRRAADWLLQRGGLNRADFVDVNSLLGSLHQPTELYACIKLLESLRTQEQVEPTILGAEAISEALETAGRRYSAAKHQPRLVPLAVACRQAGVSYCRAARLFRLGGLEAAGSAVGRAGVEVALFDPMALAPRRELAPCKDAGGPLAATLGIPVECLRSMRRGGLLPRHASKREVLGDATAALQLIDRLEAVAQPLPVDGTALVNLGSDAFWLGNMWRCVGRLIDEVLGGHVPVYGAKEGIGFQRLFVRASLVRAAQRTCWTARLGAARDGRQAQLFNMPTLRLDEGRIDRAGWHEASSGLRDSLDTRVGRDRTVLWSARRRAARGTHLQFDFWDASDGTQRQAHGA